MQVQKSSYLLPNCIVGLFAIVVLLAGIIASAGCTGQAQEAKAAPTSSSSLGSGDKIEVYHFHPIRQCSSCTAVGNYAEETVKTYFADEVASGKIVFAHINAELAENQALVEKYEVTGSSLWIGVYDASGFHKEENLNVWYKINNKQEYMDYLKGVLEKRLAGDFT